MTGIEEFTSQYGLVRKIDAFGYLDYLKSNPDAPRKHGKVVLVTADTPLKDLVRLPSPFGDDVDCQLGYPDFHCRNFQLDVL